MGLFIHNGACPWSLSVTQDRFVSCRGCITHPTLSPRQANEAPSWLQMRNGVRSERGELMDAKPRFGTERNKDKDINFHIVCGISLLHRLQLVSII